MREPVTWRSSGDDVCICSVGARTPLGLSAAASAAAVRGAISARAAHEFLKDKVGEPMMVSSDAVLASTLDLMDRLSELLKSAIADAWPTQALDNCRIGGWVGLPEPRPGLPPALGRSVAAAVADEFKLTAGRFIALERGHAAGLMGIQAAAQKIALGELDVALAAAVDSYISQETLESLDAHGLLMSEQNRNGFVPGEAAGACVMTTRRIADRTGLPIHATVVAASTTYEPNTIRGDGVCTGEGLTAAISEATASLDLPEQAITATYCDLNGERYRSEELVYTLLRVQRSFINANEYESPADCWGDVGAASGPLFAALAVASGLRGYAKGYYPVLWGGSESGYRTAVVLRLGSS